MALIDGKLIYIGMHVDDFKPLFLDGLLEDYDSLRKQSVYTLPDNFMVLVPEWSNRIAHIIFLGSDIEFANGVRIGDDVNEVLSKNDFEIKQNRATKEILHDDKDELGNVWIFIGFDETGKINGIQVNNPESYP